MVSDRDIFNWFKPGQVKSSHSVCSTNQTDQLCCG